MGRVVKWTLLLLALALALGAGSAALLLTVQQERLRDYAASQLSAALGRPLRLDGELSLALWPVPRLRLEDIRLANTPWGQAEWLLDLAALELRPNLAALAEGRVLIEDITLLRPVLNLERSPAGEVNWSLPAQDPDGGPTPELARVSIVDGLIRYRIGDEAPVTARLNGALLTPLTVPTPDLDIALDGPDGATLKPLLDRDLPAFAVMGQLGRKDNVWTLEALRIRLGESDLTGRLALDRSGDRSRLTAELQSETLDTAALMEQATPVEAGADWFDPQRLTGFDAEVRFTGTAVVIPGLRLEGLRLRLVLDNGQLSLEPEPEKK